MLKAGLRRVGFAAIGSGESTLSDSPVPARVLLNNPDDPGQGTHGEPKAGRLAAESARPEIEALVAGADMVFVAATLGGGTGGGAGPVVARTAREGGALVVSVVTLPFSFEGQRRGRLATECLPGFELHSDAVLVLPSDGLATPTRTAAGFTIVDRIISRAIRAMADMVTTPGMVNLDFADLHAILRNVGRARMGFGCAVEDDRVERAAAAALTCPLLQDLPLPTARGLVLNISGGPDLSLSEVSATAAVFHGAVGGDTQVIIGAFPQKSLSPRSLDVTVIAAGDRLS
jgi:cell division protein FtsZ